LRFPWPWWLPFGQAPEICPEDLKCWLDEARPLQLVDARTTLEFHQGTIGDACHAPLTDMPSSMQRLSLDRTKPVVVLCLTGHRSLPGVRWLRARGYEAYSLQGGVMSWKKAGFEVNPPADQTGARRDRAG
jgi:rhodanese-related sulfurtransferase